MQAERFIVAPAELMIDDDEKLVILSDYRYWAKHLDELTEWCSERNVRIAGMTVVFGDAATLVEFVLKWS